MADETQAPDVGQRIRAIRERRGLSLRALAERCGLSSNAISLIERGQNSPTVSSLHLLATALSVPITYFFENEQAAAVVRTTPEGRLRSEAEGIALESLGIGLRNQQMEPFLVTVAPRAGNREQPVAHAGEELVYCLAGVLEYCVGERSYRLEPGDTLLFDATIPHAFRNAGSDETRFLLVFHAGHGAHLARRLHLAPIQE
jgi:transcriptional regulator with XRE-family HTH domain